MNDFWKPETTETALEKKNLTEMSVNQFIL